LELVPRNCSAKNTFFLGLFLGSIWGDLSGDFLGSIFSSILNSAGSKYRMHSLYGSVVEHQGKSRKGNGRVGREMEESKGKWKSRNGNGRVEREMV
jgi:hypothetical protein